MSTDVINKIRTRINELLANPECCGHYQSIPTKEEAEHWIFCQAVITLTYSYEEIQAILSTKAL